MTSFSSVFSHKLIKSAIMATVAVATLGGAFLAPPAAPSLAASDYVLTCNPGNAMEVVAGQRVSTVKRLRLCNSALAVPARHPMHHARENAHGPTVVFVKASQQN